MILKLLKYELKEKSRFFIIIVFFIFVCNLGLAYITQRVFPFSTMLLTFGLVWIIPLLIVLFTDLVSYIEKIIGNKSNLTMTLPVKSSAVIWSQIINLSIYLVVVTILFLLSIWYQVSILPEAMTPALHYIILAVQTNVISYAYFLALNIILFPPVAYFTVYVIRNIMLKIPGLSKNINTSYVERSPILLLFTSLTIIVLMSFGGIIAKEVGSYFPLREFIIDFNFYIKYLHHSTSKMSLPLFINYFETMTYLCYIAILFVVGKNQMSKGV